MFETVMKVNDVFRIYGKGVVVVGVIECQRLQIGCQVWFEDVDGVLLASESEQIVSGIETFNKSHESACKGHEVALLIRGLKYHNDEFPYKGMKLIREANG